MEKVWYIKIEGSEEGPYSVVDLRSDRRIRPETLVRRHNSNVWRHIGEVKELAVVFEDDDCHEDSESHKKQNEWEVEEVLAVRKPPTLNWFFWITVVLIVLVFFFAKYFMHRA